MVLPGGEWTNLIGVRLWLVSFLLLAACFLTYRPWNEFQAQQTVPILSEALRIADNVHQSGEFANPFGTLPTGYTAHIPPGYPFLAAFVFRILGEGSRGWIALKCLPVLALGVQIALLPWCSRVLGLGPWTGVIAGALVLLAKPLCSEQWEAHEAGLAILVLAGCLCYWSNQPPAIGLALLTGTLAGLTVCLQPAIAPVYLGWLLFIASRKGLRGWRALPLWAAPLLVCAPWIARNEVRLGTPWIRDNFGIELNVSFNDCAPFGFEQSQKQGCFGRFHPNQNLAEAIDVRRLGEVSYNQDRAKRAFSWIAQHPSRSITLIAQRTWYFWFPPIDRWPDYLRNRKQTRVLEILTLASIGGIWLSLKHRTPGLPILGILLASFPLVYYVIQFDPRYRYPILWVTCLEAAYFCTILWKRATAKHER